MGDEQMHTYPGRTTSEQVHTSAVRPEPAAAASATHREKIEEMEH